jgi:hypothetical protein
VAGSGEAGAVEQVDVVANYTSFQVISGRLEREYRAA